METSWETELAALLTDLLTVQDQLLEILTKKREVLVAGDSEGLAAVAPQEEELIGKLQQCMARRETLLQQAGQEGMPSASIQALSEALPKDHRSQVHDQVQQASSQARLLRHHSLTNWVVIQRTLIHLSQLIEIIATGGRLQPTYGEEDPANASGSIVDQAV